MSRVTIIDIAREAGVSKSTVSRALTNHPRISEETRQRILAVSEKLGYTPDPAMRILCTYRNAKRQSDSVREFPIAVVTDFAEPTCGFYVPKLIEDIREIAVGMGYVISVIDALDYPHPQSVARVLKSRGVRGVIMMAIFREEFARDFPWEDFCVVLHGQPKFRPPCHMVREDRFDRMVRALRKSWDLGYRRPAFAMVSRTLTSRYFDLMSGAYFSEVARLTGNPVLIPPRQFTLDETPDDVCRWIENEKPDVVIGENDGVYLRIIRSGMKIPDDISYISIFRHPDNPNVTGFDMECQQMAETIVRQLDSLIRHNISGRLSEITTILVKKEIDDGDTLPEISRKQKTIRKRKKSTATKAAENRK